MKRTTAQRFFTPGGVSAVLGSGFCFIAFNPPGGRTNESLGWVVVYGFMGIAALVLAVILGVLGLISRLSADE
jgi:hypothetical protein